MPDRRSSVSRQAPGAKPTSGPAAALWNERFLPTTCNRKVANDARQAPRLPPEWVPLWSTEVSLAPCDRTGSKGNDRESIPRAERRPSRSGSDRHDAGRRFRSLQRGSLPARGVAVDPRSRPKHSGQIRGTFQIRLFRHRSRHPRSGLHHAQAQPARGRSAATATAQPVLRLEASRSGPRRQPFMPIPDSILSFAGSPMCSRMWKRSGVTLRRAWPQNAAPSGSQALLMT